MPITALKGDVVPCRLVAPPTACKAATESLKFRANARHPLAIHPLMNTSIRYELYSYSFFSYRTSTSTVGSRTTRDDELSYRHIFGWAGWAGGGWLAGAVTWRGLFVAADRRLGCDHHIRPAVRVAHAINQRHALPTSEERACQLAFTVHQAYNLKIYSISIDSIDPNSRPWGYDTRLSFFFAAVVAVAHTCRVYMRRK